MSNLSKRLDNLESKESGDVHFVWMEAEWSDEQRRARVEEFRQERNLGSSVQLIPIGWERVQEKESTDD